MNDDFDRGAYLGRKDGWAHVDDDSCACGRSKELRVDGSGEANSLLIDDDGEHCTDVR